MRSTGGVAARCRLMLVGGTPVSRKALTALLVDQGPAVVLVGEALGTDDLVQQAARFSPDLMLLDARLPDASLVLACREARERVPSAAIALHSTHADARGVVAMALSGAAGHVPKTLDGAELGEHLLAIHGRRGRPHTEVAVGLLEWFESWSLRGEPGRRISRRDRALLQHLIRGAPDHEVASQFGLDRVTLRAEIARLYLALSDEPAFHTAGARLARLLA